MPHHPHRGFTLTELLAVLVIVGLTAALAVPALTDALDRRRIRHAAEALRDDLDHARLEAVTSARAVRVMPRPGIRGWAGGWIARRGYLPLWAASGEPLDARLRSAHARPSLSFGPDGGTGDNQTITFCVRGKRAFALSVVIAKAGRARVMPAEDEPFASCSGRRN
ncbi:GspH/FimT family pseudopilin [Luteibacter aegosomatis]|uniref:GspH/FimT family pseudopilin n=1 Tax=Luteibacter aegosomatis TaxID=2911537 RepID=UPI003CE4EC28